MDGRAGDLRGLRSSLLLGCLLAVVAAVGCGEPFAPGEATTTTSGAGGQTTNTGTPTGGGTGGAGGIGMGGSGQGGGGAAICYPVGLQDGFGGSSPSALWTLHPGESSSCGVQQGKAFVEFSAGAPSTAWCDFTSVQTYDVTGCGVWIEIGQVMPTSADGQTVLKLIDDAQLNWVGLLFAGGYVHFEVVEEGASTALPSLTYNSGQHRWWRFRHNPPDVVIEFSSSCEDWQTAASAPAPPMMNAARVVFGAGVWNEVTGTARASFDNLDLPP